MENILPESETDDPTLMKILFQSLDEFEIPDYWRECLRMWRWIISQNPQTIDDIIRLKIKWLETEKYDIDNIQGHCFFCHAARHIAGWNNKREPIYAADCTKCLGVAIDPEFDCAHPDYSYQKKPNSFLLKLERMDKRRRKLERKK
jgi:hypothetical protein